MPTAGAVIEDGFDVVALWWLLWSGRAIIILFGLIGAAIATALALTATPLYRADITITEVSDPGMGAVSSLSRQFGGIAALAGINLGGGANQGADSRAVLKSRWLCEQFLARPGMLDQIYPKGTRRPTLWMAVKEFRDSRLSISEDQRTATTTVSLSAESPQNAARWANEYVALANEILRSRALGEANRNIAYLNEQIAKTSSLDIQRVMYTLIENETKSAMLANARKEYAFTVVDPAVAPEIRYSPKRTLMVILGTILGGLAGAMFVLGRNFVRRASASHG